VKRHANRAAPTPIVSEPRRVVAGCSHKRCYDNANTARRVAKNMRRHLDRCKVDAYRCTHCHFWHIGEV